MTESIEKEEFVSKVFNALDIIVFNKIKPMVTEALFIKRLNEPYKDCWALPGGFMEPNETLEEAAVRELMEETNIELAPQELHFSSFYDTVDRDPRNRVISFSFYKIITEKDMFKISDVKAKDDAKEFAWFNVFELPPLAFDHFEILQDAYSKAFRPKRSLL